METVLLILAILFAALSAFLLACFYGSCIRCSNLEKEIENLQDILQDYEK